jgi:hypothetical protein
MRILIAALVMAIPLKSLAHGGDATGSFRFDPDQSMDWNAGGMLITENKDFKCARCHAPRESGSNTYDVMGTLSGNHGPNITQDRESGIGSWTLEQIEMFLVNGQNPYTGDFVGGEMGEVIRWTNTLSRTERYQMAVYLKSLPPVASTMLHHGGVHGDHPGGHEDRSTPDTTH